MLSRQLLFLRNGKKFKLGKTLFVMGKKLLEAMGKLDSYFSGLNEYYGDVLDSGDELYELSREGDRSFFFLVRLDKRRRAKEGEFLKLTRDDMEDLEGFGEGGLASAAKSNFVLSEIDDERLREIAEYLISDGLGNASDESERVYSGPLEELINAGYTSVRLG